MSVIARKSAVSDPRPSWTDIAIQSASERQGGGLSASALQLAEEARAVWAKVLFPTTRLEEWKYTNPEAIAGSAFALAPASPALLSEEDISRFEIPGLKAHRIVFVDGGFSAALSSLPAQKGVACERIQSKQSLPLGSLGAHKTEAFAALATALMGDGVAITVAPNIDAEVPFHIINVTTKAGAQSVITPRVFVDAGQSARVTVIESHVSLGVEKYLALPVTEIRAAQNAVVDHYRLQDESLYSFHVSQTDIEQARDSHVRTHVFSFGGQLVRNNVNVRMLGSNCNAVLNGLSLLAGKQHVDNSTSIHHVEPSSESREHFKGIYADESRGVFSGTITVAQIAQKTNAFQSNQALLLSPNASIETRPQLKIWADDVKCTHGATVGQLDSDAMFYLRSRGIDRETARNFLVHAFASEVLASVQVEPFRKYVEGFISMKLEGGAQAEGGE
jgi:Fe-S cluster assembly protein SufD